jgi:hypothetical protein
VPILLLEAFVSADHFARRNGAREFDNELISSSHTLCERILKIAMIGNGKYCPVFCEPGFYREPTKL